MRSSKRLRHDRRRTDLYNHISEKDIRQENREFAAKAAVPAETFGRLVAFAIAEPEDVGINEILFRPTAQEL